MNPPFLKPAYREWAGAPFSHVLPSQSPQIQSPQLPGAFGSTADAVCSSQHRDPQQESHVFTDFDGREGH